MARKFIIGITDYVTAPASVEREAFAEAEFLHLDLLDKTKFSPTDLKNLNQVDGLLVWHTHINEQIIEQLKNCKHVVRYGVGFENINYRLLAEKKIRFSNTPDYGTEEVADTAVALILNMSRRISVYQEKAKRFESGWQENIERSITRSKNTVVGVVGVGRIGTATVLRLKAFGFQILGYDPYLPSGHEKAIGYTRVYDLKELLSKSDIVSLHCPENNETRGMINNASIGWFKQGAFLVNTARGGLVENFDVLSDALKSNRLAGCALDVLPQEPPPSGHALTQAWRENAEWLAGRLVINPHAAYYSQQAWFEMRFKAAETLRMFLLEQKIRNAIN